MINYIIKKIMMIDDPKNTKKTDIMPKPLEVRNIYSASSKLITRSMNDG